MLIPNKSISVLLCWPEAEVTLGRKAFPRETGVCQICALVSASNAHIVLAIENTYTTLCFLPSLIVIPGTYSGCASIRGSSGMSRLNSFFRPLDTLAGVKTVSAVFAPVLASSYDRVNTAVWAMPDAPSARTIQKASAHVRNQRILTSYEGARSRLDDI